MKKDNKGFSLVELIVVVAIMAVLMTVLAPQLLKYVEQSRLQKDNSAIAEIANAIKISMASEKINNAVGASTTITLKGTETDGSGAKTITFNTTQTTPGVYDVPLEAELASVVNATYATSSNTYRDSKTEIAITVTNTNGVVTISATGWIDEVGAATSTKNF